MNVSSQLRGGGVLLSGVIPIDHVPEGFHVFCSTILVLEIVSVFPYVDADNWSLFAARFRDWTVLIGCGCDREFFAISHEPSPTASEYFGRGFT